MTNSIRNETRHTPPSRPRRRQVGEERQYRVPAQTLRHNHLALGINAVNLKHRLRQIKTDERRSHDTNSVMNGTSASHGTSSDRMREAVHLITLPADKNQNPRRYATRPVHSVVPGHGRQRQSSPGSRYGGLIISQTLPCSPAPTPCRTTATETA